MEAPGPGHYVSVELENSNRRNFRKTTSIFAGTTERMEDLNGYLGQIKYQHKNGPGQY